MHCCTFIFNQCHWSCRAGESGFRLAIERGGNGEKVGWDLGAQRRRKRAVDADGGGASVLLFPDDRSKNLLDPPLLFKTAR